MKYLILDVDGVIINGYHHDPGRRRWWNTELEKDLGIRADTVTEHFFKPYWADIIVGKRDTNETLASIVPALSPHVTAQAYIDYWHKNDAILHENLVNLLKQVPRNEWQLHLATNQDKLRANYLWHNLGFKDMFDGLHASAELGYAKPDPAFFAAVNQRINFNPAQDSIVFFDDAPNNVTANTAHGWNAYVYDDINSLLSCEDPHIHQLLSSLPK